MKILFMTKFNQYSAANSEKGTSGKNDNIKIIANILNDDPRILNYLVAKMGEFVPAPKEDLDWVSEVKKNISRLLTKAFKWDKIIAHDLLTENPSGCTGVKDFLKYLDLLVKNMIWNAPLYKLSGVHNKSLSQKQRV